MVRDGQSQKAETEGVYCNYSAYNEEIVSLIDLYMIMQIT